MNVLPRHTLTHSEYLAWEAQQIYKSEYYAGEVFAQAGASSKHAEIAGNLFALFHAHLKGTHCRAYIADMKLHVAAVDAFFYPDVMVTCEMRDRDTDMYKQFPSCIAEVLSESTSEYDRTFKFACYQNIPVLRDYLLISQDVYSVEHFRLNDNGEWVRTVHDLQSHVYLDSINLNIAICEIYADIDGVVTLEEKFRR